MIWAQVPYSDAAYLVTLRNIRTFEVWISADNVHMTRM